ncbi:MAG: TlpA family protein disulfide reductase [Rhodocyclaceae bacterium]|nr:TlpA family protein disulfide reductase [Rhodocyclaceae bacterium]
MLVNFWATWCEPCVEELPFLSDIAAAEADRMVVLGINFKESSERVRQFPALRSVTYPVLLDKSGESFKKWAGAVLPTTVLIDRNGKARWRIVGALDASDKSFRQILEKLLKE